MKVEIKFPEVNKKRRGHNFYPPQAVLKKIPALDSQQKVHNVSDLVVYAHYFGPSQDWYVCEFDPESGVAFGYADLGFGFGEWGSFSLPEIEEVYVPPFGIMERDCWWDAKPAGEVSKIK